LGVGRVGIYEGVTVGLWDDEMREMNEFYHKVHKEKNTKGSKTL